MSNFSNQKQNAYNSMYLDAYKTAEGSALQERNQPINEISAMLSNSQVSNPAYQNTPTTGVAPTDLIGANQMALNQGNLNAQMKQQTNMGMMSGIFGLANTGLKGGMGGWGRIMASEAGSYTPETIARRKAMADALYNKKRPPMTHWMQGVEQLGDTFTAGMLEQKNKKDQQEADEWMANRLPGAQGATTPSVAPPAASPAMPSPVSTAPTSGKVYANDESSPLDPPSGGSRDMLARALLAEAGNQGPQGLQAVANVVRNRAAAGNFGGDTVEGVLQKPMQFEPFNTAKGRGNMAAMDPNSPQFQQATAAIDRAYAGDDPTMGATHFYAPKAQAALGRSAPKWDNGTGVDIKDHRFFGGAGTPPVMAGASPSDVSAQARNPVAQALAAPQAAPAAPTGNMSMIAEMLRNKNPYIAQRGRDLAAQALNQQFSSNTPDFTDIGEDELGRKLKGFVNKQKQTVTPFNLASPASAANSTVPQAPPGVDPKIWREAQSKRAAEEGMPAAPDTVSKLRNEVQGLPSYKNLAQAAPVYKSMVDAAGRDNRAADVNLIYGMAKIMDPGSVVRESEMTVAQAIATLPQQLKATVQSQLEGTGRLDKNVREALMQEAHSRIGSYKTMFDQDAGMYRGIAQRGRMNEADVLPSFGDFQPYKPAASAPAPTASPDRSAIEAEMKRRGLMK